MNQSKVPVGSVGYWAAMRLAEFFMICIGLLFLLATGHPFQWELMLIVVMWFFLAVYLDSCVYGFADEDGVHFRRYISMQVVPWTKIGRVSWFGKSILSIHLRAGSFLRPFRKLSSTAKAAPSTIPPNCSTSLTVAAAVPPVARRSSQMITRSPFFTASSWISRVSVPYSRA